MIFKTLPARYQSLLKTIFLTVLPGISAGLLAQGLSANTASSTSTSAEVTKPTKFSYRTISANSNTWCYDIMKDGKLFIHQTSIPGIAGSQGFKTKEQASQVAVLVIQKLNDGQMPPTVTEKELKQLKVF